MVSLLRNNTVDITSKLSLNIALIGDILKYGEKEYYGLLSSLTATPFEIMAQLYLSGIDYETIDEYDLFLNSFMRMKKDGADMSILFNNMSAQDFAVVRNKKTNDLCLLNTKDNDIIIDRVSHTLISMYIRKMLFSSPPKQKAGNKEAKDYMIERAVKKYKRQLKKEYIPFLENTIIALINTEQFKYNYESTMMLNIYEFNASVRQVMKKINYDNVVKGIYAGTISSKDVNMNEIDWMSANDYRKGE